MNKIKTIICGLEVTISRNNIHIEKSFTVRNPFEMKYVLNCIKDFLKENRITMNTPFNHRSICSMVREWIAHNNAYVVGYKRERVCSVDLNLSQKWYVKMLYFLLSLFIL